MPAHTPIEKRFWERIQKQATVTSPHVSTPCWLWTGGKKSNGYGVLGNLGKLVHVHRLSYQLHYGDLPMGKPHVCHHCDNPACVNPEHLFAGDDRDNGEDRANKGRNVIPDNNGAKNPAAILTAEKVLAIRARHDGKHGSISRLAREFGVDRTTVSLIVKRKTWKQF
jgi:hypothetical protein